MSDPVETSDNPMKNDDVTLVPEDVKTVLRCVKNACAAITKKQMALSELKLQFMEQERLVKDRVKELVADLMLFARTSEERLAAQIQCMANRRRAEMEDIGLCLTRLHPELMQLWSQVEDLSENGVDCSKKRMSEIRRNVESQTGEVLKKSDDIFSGEEWEKEYFTALNLVIGSHISCILNPKTKLNLLMRISNIMSPELLAVRAIEVRCRSGEIIFDVEAAIENVQQNAILGNVRNFLPHVMLSELRVQVEAAPSDGGDGIVVAPTSFKELKQDGRVRSVNRTRIKASVSVDFEVWGGMDVLVIVTLSEVPIHNSPFLIFLSGDDGLVRKDATTLNEELWATVGESNGVVDKWTDDLDDSDLKAMGYKDATAPKEMLSPVPEEDPRELSSPEGSVEASVNFVLTSRNGVGLESVTAAAILNLPLDQPSPLGATTVQRTRNASEINAASPRGDFTPSVSSTSSNIAAKLQELNIPELKLVQEDEEDAVFTTVLEEGTVGLDVSRMQENLSRKAEGVSAATANRQQSQADSNKLKNVSFNPETTILEETKTGCQETLPYEPGSMDDSASSRRQQQQQQMWQIRKGTTKVTDGGLSLSKSLLQGKGGGSLEDSFSVLANRSDVSSEVTVASNMAADNNDSYWEYSAATWKDYLTTKKSGGDGQVANGCDESMWDSGDECLWQRSRPAPKFDLAKQNVQFQLVKTLSIGVAGEADDAGAYNKVGVPQTVARDPVGDVTYVTDIENNVIHSFGGWEYKGVWKSDRSFIAPRYALCVPDVKHGNRHGMDVVVLDQVALYLFKSGGKLKTVLFKGNGDRFRGLAYHQEHGHVITLETVKGTGVYLVFVDMNHLKQIVKRLVIEPAGITEFHLTNTKCRYLTYSMGKVVTTDTGLGCFYVTDLRTEITRAFSYSQRFSSNGIDVNFLKQAAGVDVDPAGNVLVAAYNCEIREKGHGPLFLFTATGTFVKSVKGIDAETPVGICLDDKSLFVVDVRNRTILIYSLMETSSPTKNPKRS